MQIALVTTPPSVPSRVGDHTRRLLPHLAHLSDVQVFVERGLEGEELAGLTTRSVDDLRPREVDQVLYQLGNEGGHAFMVPLVRALGGTVVLHDWILFDLAVAAHPALERGGLGGLGVALREGGPRQARVWWRNRRDARLEVAPVLARDRFELALNRSIVRFGDAFLVHSESVAERVRVDRNAPTPIGVVPLGAEPAWRSQDRRAQREALGLEGAWRDAFLVTSLGDLRAHKRLDVVLEAVALARRSRPEVRLVLLGREHPDELDARAHVARLGLEDAVRLTGELPEPETLRWLHAGDLAVQLRGPSTGGTSEAIQRTLSVGRGVIASALDEQRELPDESVYKLHPGEGEAARLAQKLVELHDSPAVRKAMERAARDYVQASCRWERVAERYMALLERFPRPRAGRRTLWAMRLQQAGREGYARGRESSEKS